MHTLTSRIFILANLAVALSTPAFAIANGLPDQHQVIASAATVTTNRFPDADAVVVDFLGREAYQPDGTSVSVYDEYTKVLTEKGRRENSIRSYSFMAAYETVTVMRAEIIKPDGRHETIDPVSNSCVMIDISQMGANIYDKQMKVLQLSIPGLEVGDLLCVINQRTATKPIVPDTWFSQSFMGSCDPIIHAVYEVVSPADRPLHHALLRSPVQSTVTSTNLTLPDGRTLHRWVAQDVPQIFPEPQMPAIGSVAQRVLVSTAPDWPTLSRWYWTLSKPRFDAVTPEMRETVSNLVAGVTDRDARINRIFTFVSQKIRYMGITTEEVAPGFEPHDVSLTFSNRYGVCRDKAALLVAMLRLADIEAYPVLIMVGAKLDPDVPSPNFNHAIVAVTRPGGGYSLMDPTDESTRDLCPAYLGNRSYLVAHPRGESLRVSEVAPADHNMMRITSNGTLDESGTLVLDIRLAFDGINDNSYRSLFLQQKPDERRRYFEEVLKGRFPGSELIAFNLEPSDLQDTQAPLVARLSCRVPHYPVPGEGVTLVAVPWLATSLGTVNTLLAGATLKQRKYPFMTDFACGVDETVSIAINRHVGDPLDLPPVTRFHRPGVDFEMAISITNDVLNGHVHYELQQPEYSPVEYADLKKSCGDIEYASHQRLFFTNDSVDHAYVRVLSNDLQINVSDAHTWVRTRTRVCEILSKKGITEYSEMSIPFNPLWQTVELISATVSNRDGKVHVVVPSEVNIMDQEWVGGAPRYPAGKTLVISFPGVDIGSVIRSTVRTTRRNASFFSLEEAFADFIPVENLSLEIVSPLGLNLHTQTSMDEALQMSSVTNGERVVHRWTSEPQHGVAREENLPPCYEFMPTILVSAGDWAEYGRCLDRVFEAAMYGQTGACEQARAIVKDLRDVDARLTVIRDYVARTIREAGPGIQDLPLSCLTQRFQLT